ncbi:uncharacterized protein LOC129591103 [Paramacrobiotus metropolitanus]|uniref:uncharacterized protein LOC129591103 n=1 Tax=Paramacrobiotus metropolitanus TaxID=2943436 RepID=UPI002445DAF5|nr:uncharacterized protein LOC129591103 [Paramacrobiotus metropolitanus]
MRDGRTRWIRWISAAVVIFLLGINELYAYYTRTLCFGSGDCIITAGYRGGGFDDEYHRWLIECDDGEAVIGIYDTYMQFMAMSQVWCFFSFPLKPPGKGIYPYYSTCNVRNFTLNEFYCYDKMFPEDTVDTFVTGYWAATSADPIQPTLQKCCKTPKGYRIDYSRCQWKYTHDKNGEHYDGYWVVKCDTNYVVTGTGQALNPWDNVKHFTWIQCCPVITTGAAFGLPIGNRPPSGHYLAGG